MESIRSLETSLLLDMLVQYTTSYTEMLKMGTTQEEYEKCNLTIKAIQAEIIFRKMTASNTSMTDPNIMLSAE
jgi:hypothetical protein